MRHLLAPSILLAAFVAAAPLRAEPGDAVAAPASEATATVPLDAEAGAKADRATRDRMTKRWDLDRGVVAVALGTAAFRLQGNAAFQRDALYGEIHPSCALTSCENEARSSMPTWVDLRLASTSLAFAAMGVGATWLVAAPGERYGVSSLEIKLTTGGTTGLTLIGRF